MSRRSHPIPDTVLDSWQATADVMAAIFEVPAGLIMRVHDGEIEVLVSAHAAGNPYQAGERASLNTGLYCETVMASRAMLQVPNALESEEWRDNPDVALNMVAYVGVPLVWPDNEVFGTICVLDNKTRAFQERYLELMWELKKRIESDFRLIEQNQRLEENNRRLVQAQQRQAADAVELGRANAQLNQALQALTQMQGELLLAAKNAALGALVAGVSHELSTPIGNSLMAASTIEHQADVFAAKTASGGGITRGEMAGFVQLLRDGVHIVLRNLERASTLVSNFKKIANNDGPMTLCSFNLHATVNTIIAAALFRPTRHRVINSIAEDIVVTGYLGAFSDVLSELIENALRHAFSGIEQGTVTVSGRVSDAGIVELQVRDDGCGIAPEHIERLFDPFFTTTLGQGGSGLGLHTLYNLVHNAMGGKVRVDSAPGAGSGFTIAFPLPQPVAQPSEQR